jgi:putative restriction endonuclease
MRGVNLLDPGAPRAPIGCTLLRNPVFWPRERWIPWGEDQGWHRNIVRGKSEEDAARASRLLAELQYDAQRVPEEFAQAFEPVQVDSRVLVDAKRMSREGQGSFRARLLSAYGGRCAATGERLEPILDAAHVQPYLGPRSNHIQNGLLLTKDLHTLFDHGYVTVTPEYEIRVSPLLRKRWQNGARFYDLDRKPLRVLPDPKGCRPATGALRWHNEHIFERAIAT